MEIKFNKDSLKAVRPVLSQVQSLEQTQELKLPDGYPDIGRILGCWGQPIVRGKEWRAGAMSTNGGVMAWVMYAPEEGTEVFMLDAWIPFQAHWELPDVSDNGTITIMPLLSDLDARNISARKIVVRAGMEIMGQGMETSTAEIAIPTELPEDVQLLTKTYPVTLPLESAESQIHLDETVVIPMDKPPITKVVGYEMIPAVKEYKVLANRLVFRGIATFLLRYLTEDGNIATWSVELPFSDYTDLKNDYDTTATALIVPVMTALEVDVEEGRQLQIRGGIAAQYTIFDRMMLQVTEDAYSPYRDVTVHSQQLQLPILLDKKEWEIGTVASIQGDVQKVFDLTQWRKQPRLCMEGNGTSICECGQYQMLGQDSEGKLFSNVVKFEQSVPFASDDENNVQLWPGMLGNHELVQGVDGVSVKGRWPVTAFSYSSQAIPMVTGMDIGENRETDADRPSLILKRAGEESLWDLAKKYGSTVDAIYEANRLTQEPEEGVLLLVPIY